MIKSCNKIVQRAKDRAKYKELAASEKDNIFGIISW